MSDDPVLRPVTRLELFTRVQDTLTARMMSGTMPSCW
jgi:hypothetical protein